MNPTYILTGAELQSLIDAPSDPNRPAHTLRVAFDDGGVKFKVNEGMWSPPFGELRTD